MVRGSNVYWYHGDGLGSVTEVTDGNEALVEQYLYDSFGNLDVYDGSGNPLSQTAIGNPFTYIGREYDPESNLYYLRARYYSPEQGRFLARDPIERCNILSSYGSLNLYLYARNDPISQNDPSGLESCKVVPGSIEIKHEEKVRCDENGCWKNIRLEAPCGGGCTFIQQMRGSILNKNNNKPCRTEPGKHFWGEPQNPLSTIMDFPTWVVDSYSTSPIYINQGVDNEGKIWMTDGPSIGFGRCAEAPKDYGKKIRSTMEFKAGIFNASDYHAIEAGYLVGPSEITSQIWYFQFETN